MPGMSFCLSTCLCVYLLVCLSPPSLFSTPPLFVCVCVCVCEGLSMGGEGGYVCFISLVHLSLWRFIVRVIAARGFLVPVILCSKYYGHGVAILCKIYSLLRKIVHILCRIMERVRLK